MTRSRTHAEEPKVDEQTKAAEPAVEEPKTEAAEAETEEVKKPAKRKHDLPEGWITPVKFRHALVAEGLAGENLSSAQIYILSRKAASNGMPVKHFDKDGKQYDELQTHPITGETTTRPGLKLDEGLEWWKNRPKRQVGQPKAAKAEKAEGATAAEKAEEAKAEEFAEELEADEEFTEAE